MITSLATGPVPAFCASGHGVLTPAQWADCVKAGWQEPTTGAATFGSAAGGSIAPVIILAVIILLVIAAVRAGTRRAAASRS